MRIHELFIAEQVIAPVPPGGVTPLPTTTPTQQTASNPIPQAGTTATTATNVAGIPGQAPAMGTSGTGQPMGQQPQQQVMQTTMTNLDKLAAQVVGLKQQLQKAQQGQPIPK